MSWMRGLVLVLVSRAALAETDPSATAPRDPSTRAMTVALVTDATWGPTLGPGAGSEFPAVSKDGTTIVQLFQDSEDFTGAPLATVVFWSNRGTELARYTQGDAAARDAINRRLAATTWRPLIVHAAAPPVDGEVASLALDGDVTIAFDPASGRLSKRIANGRATRVRATFPAPGWRSADDGIPGGGCGTNTGLAYGFGGRDLGIAIVTSTASLGGDSCFGGTLADRALVIRLR